jgi:hypothetical protein
MPKDAQELWWGLVQENLTHARHHEQQRTSVTSFFSAISAAILGIVSLDRCIDHSDWPLLAMLFVIGIFGSVLVAKQYERYTHHMERVRVYRDSLENSVPESALEDLKQQADQKSAASHPRLAKMKLVYFWMLLHLFSTLLATMLLLSSIFGVLACDPTA